jgi:hypothetical protein
MRGYLTGFLLLIALSNHAQKRREVVTDSATLSFMQWRLSSLHAQLLRAQPWLGKTRLDLFAYPLDWPFLPVRLAGTKSAADIDTLIQQSLGLIRGADTVAYAKAVAKCWPAWEQHPRKPKPLFTGQDLQAIARSFEKQPLLMWPAVFPGFRHRPQLRPACCAFSPPIFCAKGQLVLQWEYVFGEEGLAIYQRISAHEWCLLSQPHRIMY